MAVEKESNSCFHMAITGTNTDVENAEAVRAQDVLYRSTKNNS